MPYRLAGIVLLVFCFFLTLLPRGVLAEDTAARWPLDRDTRYLTSNFMEYRGGRFHAGIDLKTNSTVGYAVRAVENGYIERVRVTPLAYGRVVYLRGESGRTFVFAHLMRFNDVLRTRLKAVQEARGSYRASLSFRPGEIPVKKGDILGLSGESGTGGPHLHFEVRDNKGWPINPVTSGFAVPDTFPPVIHSLTAWPVTPQVRVNGSQQEQVLKAEEGEGLAGPLPALTVSGPVAFSAKIIDAADIRGHRLEPWLIEVKLDGVVVYSCRNETYTWEQNSLQRLEWADQADWQEHGFREHWLHRRPTNTLTGRQGGLWYLDLAPGAHRLEIRAADVEGNQAQASLAVIRQETEPEVSPTWQDGGLGRDPASGILLTPFYFDESSVKPGVRVQELSPAAGDPVLETFNLVTVPAARPDVPRETGLVPAGPAALFLAADWPIDSDVIAGFPADSVPIPAVADDPRLGVYRLDKKGEWNLVGPPAVADQGDVSFSLAEPGLHAVLRDERPPILGGPGLVEVFPWQGVTHSGVTMPYWEFFPVPLVDLGSGLAPETIVVQLDGRPLLVEPDLPRDRILVELPDELAPGEHRLEITAADEAGNQVTGVVTVVCQRKARPKQ